ncbi:MAG: BON domain-containing protein [Pseudomonadota bacterium]
MAVEMHVRLVPAQERNDADIALAAERALEWNLIVPDNRIQLMVRNGWLTLSGEAAWACEREAAERVVVEQALPERIHVEEKVKAPIKSTRRVHPFGQCGASRGNAGSTDRDGSVSAPDTH